MRQLRDIAIWVQAVTFFVAGGAFLVEHSWRLAVAQLLLGVVTLAVYL